MGFQRGFFVFVCVKEGVTNTVRLYWVENLSKKLRLDGYNWVNTIKIRAQLITRIKGRGAKHN